MFVGIAHSLNNSCIAWAVEGGLTCQLGARVLNLITAPVGLVARVLDIAIGILALPLNLLTAGTIEDLNANTNSFLDSLDKVLGDLALNILRLVNPTASLAVGRSLSTKLNDAFCMAKICNATHPFNYYVTNRFNAIVFALAYVVTRAVDLIIGTLGLVLATATLGTNPSFNRMAYSALEFPGLVKDINRCVMLLLNPAANSGIELPLPPMIDARVDLRVGRAA